MGYQAHLLPSLLDDLDAALAELIGPFERNASGWDRGPRGKWSAGQHVEHVGKILALGAGALEQAAEALRQGRLRPRPWRDPLQAWGVAMLTREPFPRGAKAPKSVVPSPAPSREGGMAAVRQGAARHRALVERLTPEERERLWMWNPYVPWLRWHYTLPEAVRVQATHARHHARLARAGVD